MEYRLKCDLPFAKAGAVLLDNNCVVDKDGRERYLANWNERKDHCTQRLLSDGWIEEVKPREWWVTEHRDDPVCIVKRISVSKLRPVECVPKCKQIKVREVIE